MANFVLDKGYIVEGVAAAVAYRFVGFGTTDTTCDLTPTANTAIVLGVIMENIDAAKVATGKATANVRVLGIAPVTASAAITVGALVRSDADGRASAAATGNQAVGVALQAAAAAGDIINVLLTPAARTAP
jgi:Uncharacterized conserved protein (DUF2190)